jgi:hypothetical protein
MPAPPPWKRHLESLQIKILADVDKKHSVRFPGIDLATHVAWTRFFGARGPTVGTPSSSRGA